MRRIGLFLLLVLLLVAACRPNPKTKAADWAKRFPEEIGDWEADEDKLELTAENISNVGHVTITYEGEDDAMAYVSIDVYATETAADVAMSEKLRNWQLQGIRFQEYEIENEESIAKGEEISTAAFPGGKLAYRQEENAIVTLTVIPAEPAEISDETIAPLLEIVVAVIVTADS